MSGVNKYYIELETNVRQTLADVKSLQDRMDKLEGKEHKLDIGIDTEKLEKVISNLDKMLNSLGKGTGDFKQFEKLSKQLQEAKGNIDGLKKSLGTLNADKGMKNILTAINSIDSSLITLTTNLKGITSINTGGAEKEIKDLASAGDKAADSMERAAQARKKLAETDLSSDGSKSASATDNKSKSNTEYLKNVQTALTETKKRLSELKGKDLTDLEKPFSDIGSKVTELNEKLQNGEITLKQYQSAVNSAFSGYDKELSNVTSNIEKMVTKSSNFVGKIDTKKNNVFPSEKYKALVKESNDLLDKMKNIQTEIKNQDGIASQEQLNQLGQYNKRIEEIYNATKKMTTSEKGSTEGKAIKEIKKIYEALDKNTRMSSEAKAQLHSYINELKTNPSANVEEIAAAWKKVIVAEKEAGRGGKSLLSAVGEKAFYGLAGQIAGMVSLLDVINVGKQAVNQVIELDTALVDLQKTTTMSSSQLNQFYYDANDIAKQMGVTTQEIIEQASAWSRLGYSSAEAATQMAQLSSQFASISTGMETDDAQEGLVSIMKAWDIGVDDVKSEIMDKINILGNTMAESNQDIVEGMERSAAALAAVGTSTEDAFAMFSGINEVLQNAEKSGTALRSISLRLRSFDESTEEYSDDLKNITGELVDLTKTAQHTQGVSIFKDGSTTEFKSLVEYFGQIHDIWDEMSQKQQNDFLIKAFGRTQAQAGSALIQNYAGVTKALDEMSNSAGSADKEMETIKSSLEYKLNALKETWVGTAQKMADRSVLGGIIDGLTTISELIQKIGVLPSAAIGGSIFALFKNVGTAKQRRTIPVLMLPTTYRITIEYNSTEYVIREIHDDK